MYGILQEHEKDIIELNVLRGDVSNLVHEHQTLIDKNSLLEDGRTHLRTKLGHLESKNATLKDTVTKLTHALEEPLALCEHMVASSQKEKENFDAVMAKIQMDLVASRSPVR